MNTNENLFFIVHSTNPKKFCYSYPNVMTTLRQEIKTINHLFFFPSRCDSTEFAPFLPEYSAYTDAKDKHNQT